MNNCKAIIWDYNGTLLNDLEISVKSINSMLAKRNMTLLTIESYREIFRFPVKQYYIDLGFDFEKESWDSLAKEFISNFTQNLPESRVFAEAKEMLAEFAKQGKQQFILSAMEHNMLLDSTKAEDIQHHFHEISGIDNIYAESKVENGKKLMAKYNLKPSEVCLLGDTTHDYEVAQQLKCHCILVAAGHQSTEKLRQSNNKFIIDSLQDIKDNKQPFYLSNHF